MKKCILVLLLGLSIVQSKAQDTIKLQSTNKGKRMLGMSIADVGFTANPNTFQAYLQPVCGFFVADNFAIGFKPQIGYTTTESTKTLSFFIQPLIRLYFGKSKFRIYVEPTVGLYGNFYTEKYNDNYTSNEYNTRALRPFLGCASGVTFFVNEHIGFDLGVSYNHIFQAENNNYYGPRVNSNILGSNLGIKVFF